LLNGAFELPETICRQTYITADPAAVELFKYSTWLKPKVQSCSVKKWHWHCWLKVV